MWFLAITSLKQDSPKTCRFFREMSKERHLWLTLAMSLDYDHAPNLAPHESLESLSTERLREMVIRSARAYANWSSPHGPKPSRSVSFDIHTDYVRFEKLLPGGKYYAYQSRGYRFHCYDTETQMQVTPGDGIASPKEGMFLRDCFLVDRGDAIVLAYTLHDVQKYVDLSILLPARSISSWRQALLPSCASMSVRGTRMSFDYLCILRMTQTAIQSSLYAKR